MISDIVAIYMVHNTDILKEERDDLFLSLSIKNVLV